MNFDDVVRIGLTFPGVEPSTYYGTAALKVGGQWLCRIWSEREHRRDKVHDTPVLVLRCDTDAKPVLIESGNGLLFETPHYYGHGAILLRLADATEETLRTCLADAYDLVAPERDGD